MSHVEVVKKKESQWRQRWSWWLENLFVGGRACAARRQWWPMTEEALTGWNYARDEELNSKVRHRHNEQHQLKMTRNRASSAFFSCPWRNCFLDPNGTSPASAAKITQVDVPSPAKEGTYGGQMCSEIYSFVTIAAGSQIWNYLSDWGWNRSNKIVC